MLRTVLFLTLFISNIVNANCFSEPVPMSWMKQEATLSDIHLERFELCEKFHTLRVQYRNKTAPSTCKVGSGNVFKTKLPESYKLYTFSNPKECWDKLFGREGYALVIDGIVVETYITAEN